MAFDQLPSRFICYYSTFVTMVTDRVLMYNYVRILKNTLWLYVQTSPGLSPPQRRF